MRHKHPGSRLPAFARALGTFVSLSAPAGAESAPASPEKPETFEARAHGAVKTQDVGTLLAPFIDSCGGDMRELDRARCRSTTTYLRKKLPQQTFLAESNDPAAIEVSGYDGAAKGYHLSLAGCIACTDPMPIGRSREPRFVTLATPDKSAASLAAGVPVSKSTVAFDDFAQAKHWAEVQKPFLRAEFLFQPQAEGSDFTVGMAPGIALKLVGARVYNRCTGDVLVSKPPSTAMADRPGPGHEDPSCAAKPNTDVDTASPPPAAVENRPSQLSQALIADAMAKIRPQVFACYQQLKVAGMVELSFVVAGNGTVQSVTVAPAWRGTPTGVCVREAAKDAHFPAFQLDEQKFTYPFFLRQ
jgi:hypothetical protein